ncbi:PKD domain-containing protein [Candidatus Bathyarchaeota archaeon]|nr:MAG: PKD domain-containing protein [Candidatus Bathyarchaeota archaeon]
MKPRFTTLFFILLAISSILIITILPMDNVKGQPVPPAVVSVFSNLYGTNNITDTSLGPGAEFTIDINIANAPNFNAYETALFYDPTYITVASYDYSTGTIFPSPFQASYHNIAGAVRLSVANFGATTVSGSGTLFHVTFSVNGYGASPLVLAAAVPDPAQSAQGADGYTPNWTRLVVSTSTSTNPVETNVTTTDGYFRNVIGPTRLPPVALFNWSPTKIAAGQEVTFNATASFDADNRPGVHPSRIATYRWDFGEGGIGYTGPLFPHAFRYQGNYTVLLTVADNDTGYTDMRSQLLTVSLAPFHAIEIHSVSLNGSPQAILNPADTLHIIVTVLNPGTFVESFNLTISYGPPTKLIPPPFTNQTILPGASHQKIYNATLPTSELGLGTYEVDVALVDHPFNKPPMDSVVKSLFTIIEPSNVPYIPIIGGISALIAIPVAVIVLRRRLRAEEIE